MDDNTIIDLDQTEEDVLYYEVSDEEMEAAASRGTPTFTRTNSIHSVSCCTGC